MERYAKALAPVDIVTPLLVGGGRVAFVMVDAMRFEMAQALTDDLKRDKYLVNLQPRLAELPTITAVGMNALASRRCRVG